MAPAVWRCSPQSAPRLIFGGQLGRAYAGCSRARHSYKLVLRSTQMYCPCFQIMYAQLGSVSDANARFPKMSEIENTIPNTIPVSTGFIGKAPRNASQISLRRGCQKCAVWNLRCAAWCRTS
jgi:hypothetical protein